MHTIKISFSSKFLIIFFSLIMFSFPSQAEKNPLDAFKKLVEEAKKSQGQSSEKKNPESNSKETRDSKPIAPSNSSMQTNLCSNEEEITKKERLNIKIGCDQWSSVANTHTNKNLSDDQKKQKAQLLALMEAFRKQYPDLLISYSINTKFAQNLLSNKYGNINNIDWQLTESSSGSSFGGNSGGGNNKEFSYAAIVTFKQDIDQKAFYQSAIEDNYYYRASSSDPVWSAELGMKIPQTIEQARTRAIHAGLEGFFETQFPTNTNYQKYIENIDVIEEKVMFGFPISKIFIKFKKIPEAEINEIRDAMLPGWNFVIKAKQNYFNEKVNIILNLAKTLGLDTATQYGLLDQCIKSGSCLGESATQDQDLFITDTNNKIAKKIESGSLSETEKNAIKAANNERKKSLESFRSNANKALQSMGQGSNQKKGLDAFAIPFIRLEVKKRTNGMIQRELKDLAMLEYKLDNPDKSQRYEEVDAATQEQLLKDWDKV